MLILAGFCASFLFVVGCVSGYLLVYALFFVAPSTTPWAYWLDPFYFLLALNACLLPVASLKAALNYSRRSWCVLSVMACANSALLLSSAFNSLHDLLTALLFLFILSSTFFVGIHTSMDSVASMVLARKDVRHLMPESERPPSPLWRSILATIAPGVTKPEGDFDALTIWRVPQQTARDLLRVFRTGAAVRLQLPLWNYSPSEAKAAGYSGALEFNLKVASAVILFPIPVVALATAVLGPDQVPSSDIVTFLGGIPRLGARLQQAWLSIDLPVRIVSAAILPKAMSIVLPLATTLSVCCRSWGSAWPQDIEKGDVAKMTRAALYFDGAYGWLPQLLWVLGWTFVGQSKELLRGCGPLIEHGAWIVLLVTSAVWTTILEIFVHPFSLFKLRHYTTWLETIRPDMAFAPWGRYAIAECLFAPAAILVLVASAVGAAIGCGWLMVAWRRLIGA
jgi:hypothetical protein